MTTILQVFIKLNRFMTSYFGHVHIHLTGGEKYVVRNIAKPGGRLGKGSLSHTDPENEPFSEKNHDTALSNLRFPVVYVGR